MNIYKIRAEKQDGSDDGLQVTVISGINSIEALTNFLDKNPKYIVRDIELFEQDPQELAFAIRSSKNFS